MISRPARLTPFANLVIAAVGLFAALFAVEKVYNYDLWWHLRSGVWILENKAVPRSDTFSFATEGARWVNSSWLAGPVLALLHQWGGVNLLILFKAGLIGGAFAGACAFMIRSGVHPVLAAVLLGYAVVVSRFRFLLRPQMFMFPALVALFAALSRLSLRGNRSLFWLVPMVVLWVNLHGSAYIAPVLAAFLMVEAFGTRYLRRTAPEDGVPSRRSSTFVFILVAAAVLVTPYGLEIPRIVFGRSIVDDLLTNALSVEEHLPLKWGARPEYWALLIATGLSFVVNVRKFRIFHLLVYLGTSVLAWTSVRYIGLAAIVQAMILGLNVRPAFDSVAGGRIPAPGRLRQGMYLAVLVCAGWFAFYGTFGPNKVYKWGLGINESRYPVRAVDYLRQAGFSGNLYNSWELGGYVLWHLPAARTLIDGRVLAAQLELRERLQRMDLAEFGLFLSDSDVKGALLSKEDIDALNRFEVLPNYSLTYFDDRFFVYLRDDVKGIAGSAGSVQFTFVRPQTYDVSYLAAYAGGPQAKEVEGELRRAVAASPGSFALRLQLGFFLELSNRREALDVYMQAAEMNPTLAFSHYNLGLQAGQFAIKNKSWDKAAEILRMAIGQGQDDARHNFLLGTALYQEKDYGEAETAFRNVLKKEPENVATLQNLGFLYLDSGRPADAETYFEKALALAPKSEAVFYGYALTMHRLGRPEAKSLWERFLREFPSSSWAHKARTLLDEKEKN